MSHTQKKSSDRGPMGPEALLKRPETIRRLQAEGVLRPSRSSELWKAIIRSPFGKDIGLVAVRTVTVPMGFATNGFATVFLLDAKKHPESSFFRVGDFLALSQKQFAGFVSTVVETRESEALACVSQWGDAGDVSMTPLEQAEFDFQHCPRLWDEDSQTRKFDDGEYFRRLERLNDVRREAGKPDLSEGVTPSTYEG